MQHNVLMPNTYLDVSIWTVYQYNRNCFNPFLPVLILYPEHTIPSQDLRSRTIHLVKFSFSKTLDVNKAVGAEACPFPVGM